MLATGVENCKSFPWRDMVQQQQHTSSSSSPPFMLTFNLFRSLPPPGTDAYLHLQRSGVANEALTSAGEGFWKAAVNAFSSEIHPAASNNPYIEDA